jgi:hypothetical protein
VKSEIPVLKGAGIFFLQLLNPARVTQVQIMQDIILMCQYKLLLELDIHNDFDFVLLSCHKRTKKARLNINFKHLYASVKARKTRLDTVEQHPYST